MGPGKRDAGGHQPTDAAAWYSPVLIRPLSPGAEISDPLREVPFGIYGALNNTFGVRSMFQITAGQGDSATQAGR